MLQVSPQSPLCSQQRVHGETGCAIPTEKSEQEALFEWAHFQANKYPGLEWLFAIPNGLWLPKKLAVKAVKQGLKKGVSDLFLPVPKAHYHGLFIEMKRRDATKSCVRPEQKEFIKFAEGQGYKAIWCRGWEMAREIITNYLELQ